MTTAQGLRQIVYTLTLLVFLRSCTTLLEAQSPEPTIRVEGTPKVQLVPIDGSGAIWIKVTTPRNAQNRAICVFLEGPISRASCWENVGREAGFRHEFGYRGLPAGEYLLVGELQWVDEANGERKASYSRDQIVIKNPSEDF